MSDAKGQQHEPSMEEILASIRRIIAEDGEAAPAEAKPEPAPAPAAAQEEILDLTEVVESDGSVVSLTAPAQAAPAPAAEPPPAPPPRQPEPAPVAEPAEDRIVSDAAAAASVAALSQLTNLSRDRGRDL